MYIYIYICVRNEAAVGLSLLCRLMRPVGKIKELDIGIDIDQLMSGCTLHSGKIVVCLKQGWKKTYLS